MNKDLKDLIESLDVVKTGPTTFLGNQAPTVAPRTFGGQFLGHAVMVAGRSLKYPMPIHSLQAHFVRGGKTDSPIEYEVVTLREHRRYANKQVTGYQDGHVLFTALVAFTPNVSEKIEHEDPMPHVPGAEELPTLAHWLTGYENSLSLFVTQPKPIDWRYVNEPSWVQRSKGESLDYNMVWVKAQGQLPDDPLLNSAVFAFASDTTIIDSILSRNGLSWGVDRVITFTVNHSIWFHVPIEFSHWHLFSSRSPVAHGGRAISTAHMYDEYSGQCVASASQECMVKTLSRDGVTLEV